MQGKMALHPMLQHHILCLVFLSLKNIYNSVSHHPKHLPYMVWFSPSTCLKINCIWHYRTSCKPSTRPSFNPRWKGGKTERPKWVQFCMFFGKNNYEKMLPRRWVFGESEQMACFFFIKIAQRKSEQHARTTLTLKHLSFKKFDIS